MPFEFIQIPANGQGAAKEELNKLLRDGRIASVRKDFVANAEDSFWAFCVEYLDGVAAADKGRSGPKVDYKEVLSEPDFALFCQPRDLRKALAEKEAMPAYSIFTNEQLAAMVTERADTLAALGKIAGGGSAGEIPAQEPTAGAPGAGSASEAVSKAPGAPISTRPLPPSARPASERFPHAPRS